jgi:hypothetical protein
MNDKTFDIDIDMNVWDDADNVIDCDSIPSIPWTE